MCLGDWIDNNGGALLLSAFRTVHADRACASYDSPTRDCKSLLGKKPWNVSVEKP